MTAPKTKENNEKGNGVQLLVFAPAGSDHDDEDNRIYMVVPSTLKVVEVVEKFGDEAGEFLTLLAKSKHKGTLPGRTFIDDIGDSMEEEDGTLVTEDEIEALNGIDIDGINEFAAEELELDDDIVAFASDALGDIFPDDGKVSEVVSDVDMADALDLLDKEEDDSDLEELVGDMADDGMDDLPTL